MLGFEGGEVVGRATLGERAGGLHVRKQDLARWNEDFGGLGHEVHAAEDDDVVVALLRFLGQRKAVADVIGEFLYLVALVVVAEDDGVLFAFQAEYLLFQLLVCHDVLRFDLRVQRYEKKD